MARVTPEETDAVAELYTELGNEWETIIRRLSQNPQHAEIYRNRNTESLKHRLRRIISTIAQM
jgi:ubiquinone biosynthesis protein UbiJ